MIELTDNERLGIALTFLSGRDYEEYLTVCRYVEQGMLIDDATDAVISEFEM